MQVVCFFKPRTTKPTLFLVLPRLLCEPCSVVCTKVESTFVKVAVTRMFEVVVARPTRGQQKVQQIHLEL